MAMFPETYRGRGPFAEIARFQNGIHRILNNIRVFGGYADVSPHGVKLYLNDASVSFSGTAYAPDGTCTTGLNSDSSLPWVEYDPATNAFTEVSGPAPVPWNGKVYHEKANTYGNITVTRLG